MSAQRCRRLIGRPQATQGLRGNASLLPRKPALRDVTVRPRGNTASGMGGHSCDKALGHIMGVEIGGCGACGGCGERISRIGRTLQQRCGQ